MQTIPFNMLPHYHRIHTSGRIWWYRMHFQHFASSIESSFSSNGWVIAAMPSSFGQPLHFIFFQYVNEMFKQFTNDSNYKTLKKNEYSKTTAYHPAFTLFDMKN